MTITRARVIADSPATLLARITGASGAAMVQADIASIAVKAFDTATGNQIGATLTPVVGAAVSNTLQIDGRWQADSTGFNLAIPMDGTQWPGAGQIQVEVKITPTTGTPFLVV